MQIASLVELSKRMEFGANFKGTNPNTSYHTPSTNKLQNFRSEFNELQLDQKELNFLLLHHLYSSGFEKSAQGLEAEFREKDLLPSNFDWQKNKRNSYKELVESNKHVEQQHLENLLKQLIRLSHERFPFPSPNWTLLGRDEFSLLPSRYEHIEKSKQIGNLERSVCRKGSSKLNIVNAFSSFQLGRNDFSKLVPPVVKYRNMKNIKGHKAPVYCLAYDHSGRRIVTGSDDRLVKVWSADTGLLIRSLRGHNGDITDLAISPDNKFLASASNTDNLVRIWDFVTLKPITVLQGLVDAVNLKFSNSPSSFLLSFDIAGTIRLWRCSEFNEETPPKPIIIPTPTESGKMTILSSSFSPGGTRFVTAGDAVVRLFSVDPPQCIGNLVGHTQKIRSVEWSKTGSRIVSGSDDSTIRVWSYKDGEMQNEHTFTFNPYGDDPKQPKYGCTMVIWSLDDEYIIAAIAPLKKTQENRNITYQPFIHVWNSHSGNLVHTFKDHTDKVFVLENHPTDNRIVLSAGYDGVIAVFDIVAGVILQKFIESGSKAVDGKFSPDGHSFCISDTSGQLLFYSDGGEDFFKKTEVDQFFHTDYLPLIFDANFNFLDETSQLPPHLQDPYPRVDFLGKPHANQSVYQFTPAILSREEIEANVAERREYEAEELKISFTPQQPMEADGELANMESDSEPEAEPTFDMLDDSEEYEEFSDEYQSESSDEEMELMSDAEEEHEMPSRPQRSSVDLWAYYDVPRRKRTRNREQTGMSDGETERALESLEATNANPNSNGDANAPDVRRPKKKRKLVVKNDLFPTAIAHWLSVTYPLDYYYSPQLGDLVYYFVQGHKRYWSTYNDGGGYAPWDYIGLGPIEECKVIECTYMVSDPVYCRIRLEFVDKTGKTETDFYVNFHPVENEPDFLVLASKVKKALAVDWQPDMEFKMFFSDDEQYYTGKIKGRSPVDPEMPDSPWNCIEITWPDSDPTDRVSPWEIELVGQDEYMKDNANYQSVLKEIHDRETSEKIPQEKVKKMLGQISQLMRKKVARNFKAPVASRWITEGGYLKRVAYPMDLLTISQRLENGYYRRIEALQFDASLIKVNARLYNKPRSEVVKDSEVLDNLLTQVINGEELSMASRTRSNEDKEEVVDIDDSMEGNSNNNSRELRGLAGKQEETPRASATLQSREGLVLKLAVQPKHPPPPSPKKKMRITLRSNNRQDSLADAYRGPYWNVDEFKPRTSKSNAEENFKKIQLQLDGEGEEDEEEEPEQKKSNKKGKKKKDEVDDWEEQDNEDDEPEADYEEETEEPETKEKPKISSRRSANSDFIVPEFEGSEGEELPLRRRSSRRSGSSGGSSSKPKKEFAIDDWDEPLLDDPPKKKAKKKKEEDDYDDDEDDEELPDEEKEDLEQELMDLIPSAPVHHTRSASHTPKAVDEPDNRSLVGSKVLVYSEMEGKMVEGKIFSYRHRGEAKHLVIHNGVETWEKLKDLKFIKKVYS